MAIVRQRTTVFNKPVGVVRSNVGAQQVGNAISQAASGIQRAAFQQASVLAEKKGINLAQAAEESRITTINPETGKPEAYAAPEGFGTIAAEAYQRVVDKRYENSMNKELKLKAQEVAIKYPLDESSYSDIMSDYIAQMSENAEGKYKQFIKNTGEFYLAETSLNIKERIATRAREDAASSVLDIVDDLGTDILSSSSSGGMSLRGSEKVSNTDMLIQEAIDTTTDAVDAGLLKKSAIKDVEDKMKAIAARGAIEKILSETRNSTERSQLEIAIMGGGANLDNLSSKVKELMKDARKYITASNKDGLVSFARSSSVSYNSVDADRQVRIKDMLETNAMELFAGADRDAEYLSNLAIRSIQNIMQPAGFDGPTDSDNFIAATELFNERLYVVSKDAKALFRENEISLTERDNYIKDQRHAILRPFAIRAALEGNVKELQLALASIGSGALNIPKELTSTQQEFIKSINQADWYDVGEDFEFVDKLLSRNIDENQIEEDEKKLKISIIEQVKEFESAANTGQATSDEFFKAISSIDNNISLFGADEAVGYQAKMRLGFARGFVNSFAMDANAQQLNQLGLAVRLGLSEGQPDAKFASSIPKEIKTLAASVLDIVGTDEEVRSLASHLSGLESARSEEESKYAKAQLEIVEVRRVNQGGGNPTVRADRVRADKTIESLGFNYSQYNSLSETEQKVLIDLAVSAPSQKYLIDSLNGLATGDIVQGADSLLNVFTILYDYPDSTDATNAVFRDTFRSSLSNEVKEFLLDVNNIKRNSNESTQNIAATLSDRITGSLAQAKLQSVFGESKNEEDFVMSLGINGMNDIVAVELGSVAKYLALTGKNEKQITARINDIIEKEYAESKHVIDPQLNFGSMKLTRHSLEATMPNEEVRNFFIKDYVQANLPDGYSLYANDRKAEVSGTAAYSMFAQSEEDLNDLSSEVTEKQVYLVPNETAQGVEYYTYFVDDNDELRPLYYDRTVYSSPLGKTKTELMWPKFSKDSKEMNEFRSNLAEKQKQEDDALLIKEEENRQRNVSIIKGMLTPQVTIGNLSR